MAVGAAGSIAEREHGELERETAGFVDADLHVLRELAEVGVAGREFAEGVADADDRPAIELVVRGRPGSFIQLRYMKPFLSAVPNHSAERNFLGVMGRSISGAGRAR
jgi:hypothetical protein